MDVWYKKNEPILVTSGSIYINNSFVSFRLFLYSYDLLDLYNVLFLMNFDLIMLFISLILPYGRCIIVLCKVTKIVSSSVSFPHT